MDESTRNIAVFIPHLGCSFRCCFCQQQKISGTWQPPACSRVTEDIETALHTIPPGTSVEVAFFGGTFTSIPEQLQNQYLECVRPYWESGRITGIRISTRPDAIDKNRLLVLKQRGVKTVELGVQSLDEKVLALSGRGYVPAQVIEASKIVHDTGIRLGIQLMVGLPGDNLDRDLETTVRSIELAPHMVRIYPTLVIAGTQLEQAFRDGSYRPLHLEEAVDITAVMYLLFTRAHIPVIRMGLHPSEELQRSGTVLAGPFHPAFGELVLQKVALDQARCLIKDHSPQAGSQKVTLYCPPREYSQLIGMRRANILALQTEFGLDQLLIKPDENLPPGSLGVGDQCLGMIDVLSREQYLRIIS